MHHDAGYRPCSYTTEQLQAAVRSAFWVGLTEWYAESLCVLAFQLSAFDARACTCPGRRRAPTRALSPPDTPGAALLGAVDNASPDWQAISTQVSVRELQRLARLDRDDLLVYSEGVGRFLRDVREVERRTGTRVLCRKDGQGAGEGDEALGMEAMAGEGGGGVDEGADGDESESRDVACDGTCDGTCLAGESCGFLGARSST